MASTPPPFDRDRLLAAAKTASAGRRMAPGAQLQPIAPVKREKPVVPPAVKIPAPVPPAPAPVSAEPEKKAPEAGKKVEKVKRKIVAPKSKKHVVPKLPADWREQMWAAAEAPGKGRAKNGKTPKLREALAVQWISGCRPSEIEIGVEVSKDKMNPGCLLLKIYGSKVGDVKVQPKGPKGQKVDPGQMTTAPRGIKERYLIIDPKLNAGTKYLIEQLEKSGKNILVVEYDAEGFKSKLNGLGRAVIGKRGKPITDTISSYCYRHATGSDVKSCDTMADIERSAMMGHRSQASLERYGQRRRGGGAARPVMEIAVTPGQEPHGQRSHGPAAAAEGQAATSRPQG
jgi:integrase